MSESPPSRSQALALLLGERFGALGGGVSVCCGQVTLEVPPGTLLAVARTLRDEADLAFEQLVDLCGVDYLTYGVGEWSTSERATRTGFSRAALRPASAEPACPPERRFAVVSHLLSQRWNRRLRLRVYAPGEPPQVDSLVPVWSSANWFEREAFDLFGILFEGHPDLRRILTDYGFVGHPLRKDFPLGGHVEMRYDPERGRVVYEPVTVEPRVLVPRVVRGPGAQARGGDGEPGGSG
ncbi:MAG: NADH-quinone oxidoreductase subunit C [Gammaproteobacteria bacterium]|nr:NADH-quinone oxidoreductase subunit C [Gammaproteobacteria bacterium]